MRRFLPFLVVFGFLLELAVMIAVGRHIGVLAALALVVGAGALGGAVVRSAGLGLMEALRNPARAQALTTKNAMAGFLYVLAGLLLIVPGFLSDLTGLLLLPAPIRLWLAGKFMESLKARRQRTSHGAGTIIEGEAIEITDAIETKRLD
ncbi:MAG: FxsA family protein [Methylocella sp.]